MEKYFGYVSTAILIAVSSTLCAQRAVVYDVKVQMVQANVLGVDQIMFQLNGTGAGECGTSNRKLYIRRATVGTDRYRELLSVLLTAQSTGSNITAESGVDGLAGCDDINSIGLY